MSHPEIRFLIILPLTVLVECGLFLLCKFTFLKNALRQADVPRILAAGAMATALTLPYVWFIIPFFFRDRLAYLLVSESFAVVAEALLYMFLLRVKPAAGFLVSFILNAGSFLSLFYVDGWLLSLAGY